VALDSSPGSWISVTARQGREDAEQKDFAGACRLA
jgi:hypothetical protein